MHSLVTPKHMNLQFRIERNNEDIKEQLAVKINNKTKPLGALGRLEEIAIKIGIIQQSLTPVLTKPTILVFAADHGIATSGVSAYPQEITKQMVNNFIQGGAAINVFARQNGIDLKIVDAGVKGEFKDNIKKRLIDRKISKGTKNFLNGPAMTKEQCEQAMRTGAKCVQEVYSTGCNVIGFGEMGIGNTSSSSMLMHLLSGISLAESVGRGTGLDEDGLNKKKNLLLQSLKHFSGRATAINVLAHYGGFETAMIAGALLQAAENKMTILIDGFNVTAAFLVASELYPDIREYCFFTHQSDEKGHQKLLQHLQVSPILHLNMRLGEGTGVAIAYPIMVSAVRFLNDMASFDALTSSSLVL